MVSTVEEFNELLTDIVIKLKEIEGDSEDTSIIVKRILNGTNISFCPTMFESEFRRCYNSQSDFDFVSVWRDMWNGNCMKQKEQDINKIKRILSSHGVNPIECNSEKVCAACWSFTYNATIALILERGVYWYE
jgi:hypothetical protein